MEIKDYLRVLGKRAWLLVMIPAVAGVVSPGGHVVVSGRGVTHVARTSAEDSGSPVRYESRALQAHHLG